LTWCGSEPLIQVSSIDWNEAQAKKHAFLGWEPYKPMP